MTTTTNKSIIRCDRAGVFYAEIVSRTGNEAELKDARRIHWWCGAASCTQIALTGVRTGSRLTMPIESMTVLGVIEVLPCTPEAVANLDAVPVWRV